MSRYPRNVEMPRYAEFRGGLERNNEGKWMEYQIARDLVDRLEAENATLRQALAVMDRLTQPGILHPGSDGFPCAPTCSDGMFQPRNYTLRG